MITAAAVAAKVTASGAVTARTIALMTADDVDAMATKGQSVEYRPPGT